MSSYSLDFYNEETDHIRKSWTVEFSEDDIITAIP